MTQRTQMSVLRVLIERGWISLRQLGILLEKPDRSIYGRQRGKNPVSTIRIGGVERVYTDAVVAELEESELPSAKVILSVLKTGQKDKERQDA